MANWDEKIEKAEVRSWVRSWRQEFHTELGSDFRLVAHMERVKTSGDALLGKESLGTVSVTASQCAEDEVLGPLALTIQEALTAILEELRKRQSAPVTMGLPE